MGTQYSLSGTTVTYAGTVIEGFGEGDVIEVSRESNEWEHVKNADGSIVNCKILDRSAQITLRLRYNSAASQTLQSAREDEEYKDFTVEWPNGDLLEAGEVLVHKAPEIKDGQRTSNREWLLFCNTLRDTFSDGGA